jgi:hypothetical protein
MSKKEQPSVADVEVMLTETDNARSLAKSEGIHTEGISLSPETLLAMPGASFGEVVALLKEERATRQQTALNGALADFQGEAPAVYKGTKGGQGNYARYDDVMRSIKPLLSKHGLSVSFDTEMGDGRVTVTATIKHREGAQFTSRATVPVDSAMRANDSQKMGSAISYAKRYCLTAALNLVTSDEDDDGQAAGTATIDESQQDRLRELADQIDDEHSVERWFQWLQVGTLEEIPANKFTNAETALGRIIRKQSNEATAHNEL